MEIVKGIHSLIARATQGLNKTDAVAATYLAFQTIETLAKKMRDSYKAQIISLAKGEILAEAFSRVKHLERAEAVQLLRGQKYVVIGQVKCGPTYVDIETLRDGLGVSPRKWDAALSAATSRREPTLTITVSER